MHSCNTIERRNRLIQHEDHLCSSGLANAGDSASITSVGAGTASFADVSAALVIGVDIT